MNFGQALMYGAFGSLTGGMGCFGGGYGMGMMNPMSMGGSLFSMMGMGGYGCGIGGFGMGGFGCGMSDSEYVGGLLGLMGSQFLIGGVTQAIKNHKAAKAEASKNLESALETLGITDPLKVNTVNFNADSYNSDIKTAAQKELANLKYDSTMKKPNEITSTTENNEISYTYIDYEGKSHTDKDKSKLEALQKQDQAKYDLNKAKEKQYNALNNVIDNYKTVTSDNANVTADLVGKDVVAAIEAKEKAEADFEKAKEVVQNYVIDIESKDSIKNLKDKRTQVDKATDNNQNTVTEQTNQRKAENAYITSLKNFRKSQSNSNRTALISAFKELSDNKFRQQAEADLLKIGFTKSELGSN